MAELKWFPYLLAMLANICFGTASLAFEKFSISKSPFWMNQLKVSVAFVGFMLTFLCVEHYVHLSLSGNLYLLASGFLGLCVGDLFIFKALTKLGPSRTLVLYSFQPFLLALYGFLFLSQTISNLQVLAIFCMIGCVLTFVLERRQKEGALNLGAFFIAFAGIVLDAVGVMLSRQAYEGCPELGSFQANTLRAAGALFGFLLIHPQSYRLLYLDLKTMPKPDLKLAVGASILGTYVSLGFYMRALKTGHLATLTAISITLPIWVSLIEHLKLKTWPNRYLWLAFALFITGFVLMNL